MTEHHISYLYRKNIAFLDTHYGPADSAQGPLGCPVEPMTEESEAQDQHQLKREHAVVGVIAPDEQLSVASSLFGAGRTVTVTVIGEPDEISAPRDSLFAYIETARKAIDAGNAPYEIDIRLDARLEDGKIVAEIPGQTLVVGGYSHGTLHLPDDWGFTDDEAVLTVAGFGGDDKISSSAVRIADEAKQAMIQAHVDELAASAKTAQDLVMAARLWLEPGELTWCVVGRTTYVFDKTSVVALNGTTIFDPSCIELVQHRSGLPPVGYLADLDVVIAGTPFESAPAVMAKSAIGNEIAPSETVGTNAPSPSEMLPL
jgi:hypothetical protein